MSQTQQYIQALSESVKALRFFELFDFFRSFERAGQPIVASALFCHACDASEEALKREEPDPTPGELLAIAYARTFLDAELAQRYGTETIVPETEELRASLVEGVAEAMSAANKVTTMEQQQQLELLLGTQGHATH